MSRVALTKALEACEVGDYRLCVEILLVLLERLDEPEAIQHRAICGACGQGFEWPGLLDAHEQRCAAWLRWAA